MRVQFFTFVYNSVCGLYGRGSIRPLQHWLQRPLEIVLQRADQLVLVQGDNAGHTQEQQHQGLYWDSSTDNPTKESVRS